MNYQKIWKKSHKLKIKYKKLNKWIILENYFYLNLKITKKNAKNNQKDKRNVNFKEKLKKNIFLIFLLFKLIKNSIEWNF